MQLKELAESRASLLNFDPRKLQIKPGLNARDVYAPEHREHLEWMAQSIAELGVRKPLTIFKVGDDVFVADGHFRLAGAKLAIERGAPIETVPCIPEAQGTNDLDRILNQSGVDNSGMRLTSIEEGANIKRAVGMGASVATIAKRISRSISYVQQALAFQGADAEVHEMVKEGVVSTTLAAKIVREEGAAGTETLRKAVSAAKANGKKKATARNLPAVAPKKAQVASSLVVALQKLADEIEFASLDMDRCNPSVLEGWAKRIRSLI